MKITVVGQGYVGLSLSTLLSQQYQVTALDIVLEKVEKINNRISPIDDSLIKEYFSTKELNLKATLDYQKAFKGTDFVIICTPTVYDDNTNQFDTSQVESVIKTIHDLKISPQIIIRSTVPVGFTNQMKSKYNMDNIFFSPEFLREGNALYDNLNPSRIIIGDDNQKAKEFANMLIACAAKKDVPVIYMSNTEAEAVKLFSNTYLALRIAYFNELDTYAELNNINTKNIIEGVCADPRIGNYYNNPSFGYGGFCLPKDTKQLLSNYQNIPQNLIKAIIESNSTRKKHIADMILTKKPKSVGIYRLTMKKDADNFRTSAISDVIELLLEANIKIVIYEPTINDKEYQGIEINNNLNSFKKACDIIIANRISNELNDVINKVYSRDVFNRD